jgi:hypothetical protein
MTLHFHRYEPNVKLTKANSALVNDRVFFFLKKDYTGKAVKCYIVYDYETKIQVGFFWNKEDIVSGLERIFKKEKISNKLDMLFRKLQ